MNSESNYIMVSPATSKTRIRMPSFCTGQGLFLLRPMLRQARHWHVCQQLQHVQDSS